MTRALREWHRRLFCALAVGLPVAFSVGLAARKGVPVVPAQLTPRVVGTNALGSLIWSRTDLWPGQDLTTRLRRDASGSPALELISTAVNRPDVLVYWVAGKEEASDSLPTNARLLGALATSVPLPVPAEVQGTSGRLVLYSLAVHELVGTSKSFLVEKF